MPGRLDRDVRAGADRDPDIGGRECGGVVDAVADHGDRAAALLEALDGSGLVRRQHLRGDLVDAEPARDRVGDRLAVAGDHRDPDAEAVQRVDRLLRLRPDLVLDGDGADDASGDDDMQDGPTLTIPVRRDGQRFERHLGEQPRAADGDLDAVDAGASTATGQRLEPGGRTDGRCHGCEHLRRSHGRAGARSRPRRPPRAGGRPRRPARRQRAPARPGSGSRSCRR